MRRRTLLIAVLALNVAAALPPFRSDVPRHVTNRLERRGQGAWVFSDPSLATTGIAPRWIAQVRRASTITVNLRVRPAQGSQSGPARILTISRDVNARNLMIAQERYDLIVRVRRPGADANGMPAYVVGDVFRPGEWRDIAVGIRPGRLTIAVDGAERVRDALPPGALGAWDPAFALVLGNEVGGERQWVGRISTASVTIAGATVDLLAPGVLDVPDGWWHIPERVRAVARVTMPADAGVALLHMMAFAPLGYLLVRAGRKRITWTVVGGVAAVGLVIELAKVVVEGRHPSLLNLVAQFAGGVSGAQIAVAVHARSRRAAVRTAPPAESGGFADR